MELSLRVFNGDYDKTHLQMCQQFIKQIVFFLHFSPKLPKWTFISSFYMFHDSLDEVIPSSVA